VVLVAWTTVPVPPGSLYGIGYIVTIEETSTGAGGTGVVKDTNQYAVQLLDGHTFNIYVKAGYFNANSEINTAESAPSNTITVSTLPPVAPTPSISATVIQTNDPVFGPNFGLLIEGSNFGKSEQVSITVTRTIAGDSGSLFALGNFTTDGVFGGFSTTFTSTAGLCPIDVPIGQPQPVQNFFVTVTDSMNKTFSTTGGPFTCPFPAS
jgi:hypothetical protein